MKSLAEFYSSPGTRVRNVESKYNLSVIVPPNHNLIPSTVRRPLTTGEKLLYAAQASDCKLMEGTLNSCSKLDSHLVFFLNESLKISISRIHQNSGHSSRYKEIIDLILKWLSRHKVSNKPMRDFLLKSKPDSLGQINVDFYRSFNDILIGFKLGLQVPMTKIKVFHEWLIVMSRAKTGLGPSQLSLVLAYL